MKNTMLLFLFVLITGHSRGQNNLGSIGIGIGGSIAIEQGVNDNSGSAGLGMNFHLNGMFNISRQFSAGVEFNGNLATLTGTGTSGIKFEATIINGFLVKGKYNFSPNRVSPYFAVLAGAYTINPGGFEISIFGLPLDIEFEKKTSFGFAPEFGVKFKTFQIDFSAHFPGNYKLDVPDGQGGTVTLENRYRLYLIKIGWNIGFGIR